MSKQVIAITLAEQMAEQRDNQRLAVAAILALGVYFLFFAPAYAGSPIAGVLCSVITTILVDVGRGIATLAVVVLGISALLGRATWAQGLTILAGIAIIFGAPGIALGLATATVSPALSQLFGGTVGNIASVIECNVTR